MIGELFITSHLSWLIMFYVYFDLIDGKYSAIFELGMNKMHEQNAN
jgi:hypothetical protein